MKNEIKQNQAKKKNFSPVLAVTNCSVWTNAVIIRILPWSVGISRPMNPLLSLRRTSWICHTRLEERPQTQRTEEEQKSGKQNLQHDSSLKRERCKHTAPHKHTTATNHQRNDDGWNDQKATSVRGWVEARHKRNRVHLGRANNKIVTTTRKASIQLTKIENVATRKIFQLFVFPSHCIVCVRG
jgi:hypothetical protein